MRPNLRSVAGAVILSGLVATIMWMLAPAPVAVETAPAVRSRFEAAVDEDGKTRVRERYVVAAPVAGRLARVALKAGDRVAAGETVATIAPALAPFLDPRARREAEEGLGASEAALERARAALDRTRAQARQAHSDLERARALFDRGVTTAQAFERAELAARVAERDERAAEFQLHAAEHELAQARAVLARYGADAGGTLETWNVTAPVASAVLKVVQESEVTLAVGTPILEIGDQRDLEVVVDVLSRDAVEIRAGAPVTFENWGGGRALRGRVRRVEPAAFTKVSTLGVEEQRVNVLVDIVSAPEDWSGLGDGYQLDARITVFVAEEAIVVPAGALFRDGDTWRTFVVENGRAQPRTVTLLRRSGRAAAVASGLAPGERVIVYPSDRVGAGVRVAER